MLHARVAVLINRITDRRDLASKLGNIFTAFNSGLCAGAFVWGVLVDIIGESKNLDEVVTLTRGQAVVGHSMGRSSYHVSLDYAWVHLTLTVQFLFLQPSMVLELVETFQLIRRFA